MLIGKRTRCSTAVNGPLGAGPVSAGRKRQRGSTSSTGTMKAESDTATTVRDVGSTEPSARTVSSTTTRPAGNVLSDVSATRACGYFGAGLFGNGAGGFSIITASEERLWAESGAARQAPSASRQKKRAVMVMSASERMCLGLTFGCAVAASIKCKWAAVRHRQVKKSSAAHLLP